MSQDLALDFDGLEIGHKFPPVHYELSAPTVLKYLKAIGGRIELYQSSQGLLVPPTALLALAMRALAAKLSLPAGTIHASQECQSLKPVLAGSAVTCQAQVSQKQSRGPMHLLSLDLEALGMDGEPVLKGRATMILPRSMP